MRSKKYAYNYIQKLLSSLGEDQLKSLYLANNSSLTKTAENLDIGIESLRKYLIRHNIDYSKQVAYHCDHAFFSQDNELTFYWAGFIAADGNIEKDKPRLKIELQMGDKDHVVKFAQHIKYEGQVKDYVHEESRPGFLKPEYYSAVIRMTSKQVAMDLKSKFNITPAKSKTFQFPIHLINNNLIRHFIRGLIDGDGSVDCEDGANHGRMALSGTKSCVETVFNHLKNHLQLVSGDLGMRADGLWIMDFGRLCDLQKIVHYLYDDATIWLDRKKKSADNLLLAIPRKMIIDKDKLWEAYLKYQNYKIIAQQFGCSTVTLRRRMHEFGLMELASKMIQDKMPYNIFKKSNKQELENIINKHKSIKNVANAFNISQRIAKEIFEKHNVSWRLYKSHKNTLTEEYVAELYGKIKTIRGIARETGIDRTVIKSYLRHFKLIT